MFIYLVFYYLGSTLSKISGMYFVNVFIPFIDFLFLYLGNSSYILYYVFVFDIICKMNI